MFLVQYGTQAHRARRPQRETDMNLFKGLLFLHGHITDPGLLDDDYASSYGNKAAAERRFQDAFAQPTFARRESSPDLCSAAGCG